MIIKPIADVVQVNDSLNSLEKHPQVSEVQINYDPTAPLSEEEWPVSGEDDVPLPCSIN